jgi:hypothetical protein
MPREFAAEAAGAGSAEERVTATRNTAAFAARYTIIQSPLIDDVTIRKRGAIDGHNQLHAVGVNVSNRTSGEFSRLFDNFL